MPREELLAETTKRYEEEYRRRTPRSAALMEAARASMPGGFTRDTVRDASRPTVCERFA